MSRSLEAPFTLCELARQYEVEDAAEAALAREAHRLLSSQSIHWTKRLDSSTRGRAAGSSKGGHGSVKVRRARAWYELPPKGEAVA